MSKIRVLVVDDSAFMRKAIQNMLANEADIEVVAFGTNGQEAIDLVAKHKPDVMTLDIEMPVMDGLTALQRIMKSSPLPIIMVSSLTQEGADATLKALEYGAVDFIPKEKSYGGIGIHKIADELKEKIRKFTTDKSITRRTVANIIRSSPSSRSSSATALAPKPTGNVNHLVVNRSVEKKLVVLGTSTGGPQSLQKVIPLLPKDFSVPIVLVQHMPPSFTQSLAQRLNQLSQISVIEAQGGEVLEPGTVYIAKGGKQMMIKKAGLKYIIEIKPEDSNYLHNPSVDYLASSVADVAGKDALGVIMTGMGNDGMKGLTKLKQSGGFIIAQNEPSCIVYGMPRAVVEAGIADEIVPLEEIASRIVFHCRK